MMHFCGLWVGGSRLRKDRVSSWFPPFPVLRFDRTSQIKGKSRASPHLLRRHGRQSWEGLHVCPRLGPSDRAQLCTYSS
eukprot:jgi/Botrbrau1/9606/Bobra.106_2s0027.1